MKMEQFESKVTFKCDKGKIEISITVPHSKSASDGQIIAGAKWSLSTWYDINPHRAFGDWTSEVQRGDTNERIGATEANGE
jgi:hypothetical protein